jgi:hypothetical protein
VLPPRAVAALFVLCAWQPVALGAQAVGAGPLIQSYHFDDASAAGLKSIQLITSPFAVSVPVVRSVVLSVSGAYASGAARAESGEKVTLSGLTDTSVDVTFGLGVDWLVLTARATVPTGNNTHTVAESLVAGVVAAELLPFAIKTWGSGGSAGATVAAARQLGRWGLGLSAGYWRAGKYEPLQARTLGYRPGDQFQARLALDRNVGSSGTFSILVGVQRFASDQLGGNELFQSGMRLDGILSYAFALGLRSSALLYGGVNHRANGTLLQEASSLGGATDAPSQQLFVAGADVRLPLGRRASLRPSTEVRVFRAEDGASQGWVSSFGGSLDYRIAGSNSGKRLVVAPMGRVRLGRVIVTDDLETSLLGWEAGVTLSFGIGR